MFGEGAGDINAPHRDDTVYGPIALNVSVKYFNVEQTSLHVSFKILFIAKRCIFFLLLRFRFPLMDMSLLKGLTINTNLVISLVLKCL